MREFAYDEYHTYKCRVCGCKNKTYIDLLFEDKIVGYSLHCCNCGNTMIFTKEKKYHHLYLDGKLRGGRMYCHRPSYCPYKNCRFYNCNPNPKHDDADNKDKCSCKNCYCYGFSTTTLIPTEKFI